MHPELDKKFSYNYLAYEKTCLYMAVATHSRWQGEVGPAGAWLIIALLPVAMVIQGMSSLAAALSIKLTEVLYVLCA
jgi:hypothetical protein